jgi:Spy/CpxP family protein refolding chaperone
MKTLLILSFFIAVSVTYVSAQPGRSGMPGSQHLIVQYADELGLTEEQKTEMINITLEARQQYRGTMRGQRGTMRGFRSRADGRRFGSQRVAPQRFEQAAGQRASFHSEILDVLTEEQKEQLNKLLTVRAENAHEFRTLRHQLMVSNAGIEGEKADRALEILNRQSELRLDLARQRVLESDTPDSESRIEAMAETRQLNLELKNLLTVAEYQQLTGNRGMQRFEARSQERRPRRGNR